METPTTFYCFHLVAGSQLGLGHLSRCSTLALELLKDSQVEVVLCVESDIELNSSCIFRTKRQEIYKERQRLLSKTNALHRILLTDCTDLTLQDAYLARSQGFTFLVHLNDFWETYPFADLYVNGGLSPTASPKGIALQGLSYHMLTESILDMRPKEFPKRKELNSCLITCGGADPGHLTEALCKRIVEIGTPFNVTIAIGPAFPEKYKRKLYDNVPFTMKEFPSSRELGQEMLLHDVVVSMAGITAYEAFYLGCPLCVVEWERNTPYAQLMHKKGLAYNLGKAGECVFPDAKILSEYAYRAWGSVDGKGPQRIREAIKKHIKRKNRTLAIVQARMGSSRLPGKSMMPLCGKPLLQHVIERLNSCKQLDGVIVATTISQEDDVIEALCYQLKTACYRGSQEDVLQRFSLAAQSASADIVVRVTADCPFICPHLVDRCIETYRSNAADCAVVSSTQGFPRGVDVEVFSSKTLERLALTSSSPQAREHVTADLYPSNVHYVVPTEEEQFPRLRLCVDEDADYTLVNMLYEALYKEVPIQLKTVLSYLRQHPELLNINRHVQQKK